MGKILLVCAGLLLAACAYKHEPIYNVYAAMPVAAQSLPPERIESLIVDAGQQRGWRFQHLDTGHLAAILMQSKFQATVDIYFDQQSWRILYQNSTGFGAEDGRIHDHYNMWVRNLEHDITVRLNNAAILSK